MPLDHWVRLNKPEEVGFASAARRSVEDLAPERAGAVPPPIPFILEKELGEHNAIMREAADAGARGLFVGPLRPDEAAEQQARGLKHDNTNGDIDGSQQSSRGGEWKARIDAGNY